MYSRPEVSTRATVPRSSYVADAPAAICCSLVASNEMVSLPEAAGNASSPPRRAPEVVAKLPAIVLEPSHSFTVEVAPMSTVDLLTVKVTYFHPMEPAASAVTVKRPIVWLLPLESVSVILLDEMVGIDFLTYIVPFPLVSAELRSLAVESVELAVPEESIAFQPSFASIN